METQSKQQPSVDGASEDSSQQDSSENHSPKQKSVCSNSYRILRDKQQQEVNDLPIFFAFNEEQFEKGMKSFGLSVTDTDKIYKFGSTGGFYRRTDAKKIRETFDRHENERQKAIDSDLTGEGYIYDMFCYELANYEYLYTRDLTDTLEALDLTFKDVKNNGRLGHGLEKALEDLKRREQMEDL